jgi:hypothetical protein
VAEQMREEIVLATLLAHPDLLLQFEADLDRVEMLTPLADRLRAARLAQGGGRGLAIWG